MKNYIITYTDDGGATFNVESVNAADYTKAYLAIIYKYLFKKVMIINVMEV